ncbi:hypothetical protein GCM10010869_71930 [Mesorhizobium tianshanense]|uniref:Uncharacterized protein n=1 Tax=Mesorhizobium tianshanense TaxID=39844 RepID=A0A562P4I5_9HYPH|nr:hypothetical protein [Mesorhizobium tianshanense]TWI39160.1 hypothetical protein IQ26_02009 [Mesorhizobium tianshanense]GLS41596.1 hypothetical protein GCM10010869_71930 [Mesorhizobium tianshanense]
MRRQTVFIGMTPTLRLRIETTIENLLALLDEIDGDPDLEPWLAGGAEVVGTDDLEGDSSDDEWSLGWTRTGAYGLGEDLEGNLAGSASDLEGDGTDYGEIVTWPENLKSQEVLVSPW